MNVHQNGDDLGSQGHGIPGILGYPGNLFTGPTTALGFRAPAHATKMVVIKDCRAPAASTFGGCWVGFWEKSPKGFSNLPSFPRFNDHLSESITLSTYIASSGSGTGGAGGSTVSAPVSCSFLLPLASSQHGQQIDMVHPKKVGQPTVQQIGA